MDHDIGAKLTASGIQSFAMYSEGEHTIDGLHTGAFVWGGDHFHKMVGSPFNLLPALSHPLTLPPLPLSVE